MNLKDKSAIITGGSKGIGYFIAKMMVDMGMHVCITGRDADTLHKAVDQLNATGPGSAIGVVADVRSMEAMKDVNAKTLAAFGKVDVVIANAGIGHFAPIDEMTPQQWQDLIDINLTGVFNTVKASMDALKNAKGYIITIASLAGTNFFARGAAYNASKFGLVGFTQAMMLDLRPYDIKCSTIMPGSVSTYFNGNEPSEKDAWKIQPEDIAQIVIDLLRMHPRTLPSKVEVRPSKPPSK